MIRHHDYMAEAGRRVDEQYDLFGFVPAMTQCGNCDKPVPLKDAVISTFHITETMTEVEHFCCPTCAKDWWETFHARD